VADNNIDLTTSYLGLSLRNPIVASSSPLSRDVGTARQLEDNGASAIVMYSLFEEQIKHEAGELAHYLEHGGESFAESLSYFPRAEDYAVGPEEYLEHVGRLKAALDVPVIASLNGVTEGGWTEYARKMEEAGADALELNVYHIPTDPKVDGRQVEDLYLQVLNAVKSKVKVPVSVKLSPYFSAMAHMAKRLEEGGANGLVLFNRFYQPDLDLDALEVVPNLKLSSPQNMRLPLRWIAILYGRVSLSLAATSGIDQAQDVIKMIMAGASVTMICATLLRNGPGRVAELLSGIEEWMEQHEYESVEQMQGSMSQIACADPSAFERANYMRALQSYAT
jgi:dihydroorotate dehydrogenase (fumarate)